ncbi:hypothetical protein LCGC14_0835950 [marine sediment metagenome]|uniref:DegT/DnrJ/EryC1/StrS aminotransferase n=1 Tax=marine sediment metagenome TaxID=412755 RepID=A0A0F9PEI9_9ZZZZ
MVFWDGYYHRASHCISNIKRCLVKVKIGGPFEFTPPMRANVQNVMNSGRLSPGPTFVGAFEKNFREYHQISHAVMTNSGTSALVIAIQALKELEGWPDGSEVIVPAITFVATVNAVIHCNLKPVLVDVRADDYTIDTDLILNDAITTRTKAIIPVHVFGLPADMHPIQHLAQNHDLRVIEDACEALGATYNGQPVGAIADIGCFSFYMSHHITAGVGGMAITGNPRYAWKMKSLLNHGWDRLTAPIDVMTFDFEAIKSRYHFTSIGHSFRATELEAAIALPQLDTLKSDVRRRVTRAKRLSDGLKTFADKLQLPFCPPHNRTHSYMMYPIVVRDGKKWPLIKHLEKNGVETREMLPLTNQPCYEGLFDENDYPIAKWINEGGFYIGCSQYLTRDHLDYTIEIFGEYFG